MTRLPQGITIRLEDGHSKRSYDLALVNDSLQVGTISQSDTLIIRNDNKQVGDFDEQRAWKNGRGIENFSDNGEGFWDSQNLWSLTPKHIHQTLQWYFADGLRNADYYMPTRDVGNVSWQALYGSQRYVSRSFTASASYNMANLMVWIRKVGSPGTGSLAIWSDSAGNPSVEQKVVTFSTTDITDTISVLLFKTLASVFAATSGTTYHFVVYGAPTDTEQNHWEVGVDASTANSKISSAGSSWAAAVFSLYYRITDADKARRFYKVFLDGATYVVDSYDNKITASTLYINGDRGKATSGASTSITDTARSWTNDRWKNAYVKIVRGTGAGQVRQIIGNSTGHLLVAVWDTVPDNTSEFIIYGTSWFTPITLNATALGWVSGKPVISNGIMYFPQGDAVGIMHVQWNSTTKVHDSFRETPATTTGTAFLLYKTYDRTDGPQLWRANNVSGTGSGGAATVSRASTSPSGAPIAYNTALIFKTAVPAGESSFPITSMSDKDASLYVFKEDGVGNVTADQLTLLKTGIDASPDPANGAVAHAHQQFIYYSWLHSLIQVYGASHDDIGRAWNLPSGREGNVSGLDSYISLLLIALDAGEGTSSVLVFDGQGFHELLRGYYAGKRIRNVMSQPCFGTRNRIWTDIGGELVFQEMPLKKMSPRLDSGVRYMHEAVIESSTIDMGTASALPKYINDLTVTARGLSANGNKIEVDWQADDNVHTNNWVNATALLASPESTAFLGLENVRKFAYRLRIVSANNATPIDIEGIVPNGFARTPFKMLWTMQVKAGGVSSQGQTISADALMRWILDASRASYKIRMLSTYEMADDFSVNVHPGTFHFTQIKRGAQGEVGSATLMFQES